MTDNALQRAISIAGTQARLGELVGKSQGHVSKWLQRGRVPPNMAIPIEIATGVSRSDLRPDLYPEESAE